MLKKIVSGILSFADRVTSERVQKKPDVRKFVKPESDPHAEKTFLGEDARQESLSHSQGKSDFSGSGYNGPGNVDREKRNSNMSQRNY